MLDLINALLKFITTPPALSADSLKFDLTATGAINGTILTVLFDICSSVAMSLTLIYFLIEINRRLVFEATDVTLKTVFVPFLKLLAALGLIAHAKDIAIEIMDIFNSMVDKISIEAYEDVTSTTVSGLGIIACAFLFLPLLLVWLVSLVVEFVYWYKAIGFKLEFFYRAAVTPIAMADIYNDFSSGSVRWIKGLFAFGLYGLAFMILPSLCNDLVAEIADLGSITDAADAMQDNVIEGIWDFIKALIGGLLAPIAAIGTLSVVKQLTKEAVGG